MYILRVLCEVRLPSYVLKGLKLVSLNSTDLQPKYQGTLSHPTYSKRTENKLLMCKEKGKCEASFDVQWT